MWLATKLAAGQRIAPMKQRNDQLGLDGAIEYRELYEAHPDLDRGPDEEIQHHYNRLRAEERRNPKLGARKQEEEPQAPGLATLIGAGLTQEEAITYRKLYDKYGEDVERGHDEDAVHHFERLKKAEQDYRSSPAGVVEQRRRAEDPRAKPVERSKSKATIFDLKPDGGVDLKGLPQRIPGLFTNDSWAHGTIPDHTPGPERLPQRSPGTHYVDPALQAARPWAPRPSREEWVRGLADKGIYLNPDGSRMTPEQMQLPMRYPLPHEPRVWQQFIDRPADPAYAGRHRASMVVVAYIMEKLAADYGEPDPKWMAESPAYAAWWNRHTLMTKGGWDLTESGGGNYYHKQVGDKHHFIVGEPDGWTHYVSGSPYSYAGSMGTGPFDDIEEAVLHSKYPTRGFSSKPRMTDDTHRPGGLPMQTAPMDMMPGGPSEFGKFQTLSRSWEDKR